MTEYKMFEGCTIGNRIPFIEVSSMKVFEKVGIETSQTNFSCCPDPTGMKSFDNDAWLTLGARNLSLAEAEGKDIISLCNGCTNTLRGVRYQLEHDSSIKDKVNKELAKIGREYKGKIDIKYIGLRPGEKIHEILISEEEIPRTVKRGKYYIICPVLPKLRKIAIKKPALSEELSSADYCMPGQDLRKFLQAEGYLKF